MTFTTLAATTETPVSAASSTPPPPQRAYPLDDYLNLPREADTWLIKPLIPAGGNVNLYGSSKVGKSFSAIQLAAALTGTMPDWLGFAVTGIGPTLYVQLDTPRSLWMARLDEIRTAGFDLTKIHFADRETLDTWPFNIMLDDHFARLRREVERIAPVAVILDTIRETHSGDENDSGAMKDVVARLEAVVRPAALILISHARKPSHETGPDLISDARGSSYVAGRMDAIIKFTPKHMIYTGRAVEEGTIKLARLECGLWTPAQGEIDTHVTAVLADTTLTTISQKAKVLSQRIVKSEEACRSLLRRSTPRPSQPS